MAAELTREQAAEDERHDALIAEARRHAENIVSEVGRYAEAVRHVERVYRLRLGLPELKPSTAGDLIQVLIPKQET